MATPEQIAQIRRNINQPDNVDPWTDEYLSALIDGAGSVDLASAAAWEEKAAQVVDLVNISEGGSSRANGALHTQYLNMARQFREKVSGGIILGRASRTREAVRP